MKGYIYTSQTIGKPEARWFGPFTMVKQVGKNAAMLDLPIYMRIHPFVHVSLTKPAINKSSELAAKVPTRSEAFQKDTDGTPLFKAMQALSHRRRGRG